MIAGKTPLHQILSEEKSAQSILADARFPSELNKMNIFYGVPLFKFKAKLVRGEKELKKIARNVFRSLKIHFLKKPQIILNET